MQLKVPHRRIAILSVLSLLGILLFAAGGSATAAPRTAAGAPASSVRTSSLGTYSPTFAGPAATGCMASGCNLLSGPYHTTSTASVPRALVGGPSAAAQAKAFASPRLARHGSGGVVIPTVSCPGSACNSISTSAGGAIGVKGINAVDSATNTTNIFKDVEPPDQGLCAGNGSVIETNNIGEMLVFSRGLHRVSPVISLDTVMGLASRQWSSGGDPTCLYDSANGGHWFISEFVSASPESQGGPFAGCFAGVANTCYEAIAVTTGSNPLGPYNVYYLNSDFNPSEPGAPYLLNDYAKISASRDAFLLFYDEFPLRGGGIGGGFFNGAQQFAFNKKAFENGLPVMKNGSPNPAFTVAIENMGFLPTPNGTCASDSKYYQPGNACWFSVIPAVPSDSGQWDNSHGGSAFMVDTLDSFYWTSDNRIAAWDWTGLKSLNSSNCSACGAIHFGGQLFSGVLRTYNPGSLPSGLVAPQKVGPIPLGDLCGKAGLSVGSPPPAHCPEFGIATNSDQATQASQGQGQVWFAVSTQLVQTYSNDVPETHMGAAYWVLGTASFDRTGNLSLTSQGYVSAAHEDLAFPAIAAEGSASAGGNGRAVMSFTLTGNGGQFGADNGGFYPSSAFGRLTSTSGGLSGSVVNVADLGQSPQDGFTEYQGYPNVNSLRPRWGDYGSAIFMPGSGGRIYFASEYIQSPNCAPPQFTLTIGTCGGTRDGNANWGTSVNYVVP